MKLKQKFLDEYKNDFYFYNEAAIEQELENDEISSTEEGFMIGYLY